MKRLLFLFLMLPLLAAACGSPEPLVSPTATVPLLHTPSPTQMLTATLPPPTPTPTPQLIEGTLAIKVNVRSGPGISYDSIGLLNAGEKVQVILQEGTGTWYKINYPDASGGIGWVAAQFVQVAAGTQVPFEATPTPAGPSGRVLQRLNVRSGPGLAFESLGMLEPDSTVALTGKNSRASWFQIDYPAAPGGRGWVTAQYIQADAADLPVLDDYGTPVAGGMAGPTPIPVTPTPTIGPAFADADSPANPAVRVTFSSSGTRQFTYSSQVSAPDGDTEDWVVFTPYAVNAADARLVFSLVCSGNGTLIIEMEQGGTPISGWGELGCTDLDKTIMLPAGRSYTLRLVPAPGEGLRLVDYVLIVRNVP